MSLGYPVGIVEDGNVRDGQLAVWDGVQTVPVRRARVMPDVDSAVLALTGGFASTPDHASLDVSGPLWLALDAAADNWASGAIQNFVAKWQTTGNQRQYRLRNSGTGIIIAEISTLGSDTISFLLANPGFAAGTRHAIAVLVVPDNGSDQRTATLFTADTLAGPFTQLGTTVIQAGAISIVAGTFQLNVGAFAIGSQPFAGLVYGAQVVDGVPGFGGTLVANPDFWAQTPGATSFTDSTGKVWTLNGNAALVAP
jgi:hypothetical protein